MRCSAVIIWQRYVFKFGYNQFKNQSNPFNLRYLRSAECHFIHYKR